MTNEIDGYQQFVGGAVELAECAVICGAALGWTSVDPDRTNERLVRYYVTEGVVDRPDRVGRDAVYQFRHLLQLLNARRLAEKGVSLSMIGDFNRRATTQELRAALDEPAPTEAELLVRSFKVAPMANAAPAIAARMNAVHRRSAVHSDLDAARSASQRPPTPAPDVAAEVTRLRDEFAQGMKMIEQLCVQLDSLIEAVRQVIEANAAERKDISSQINKLSAGAAAKRVSPRRKAAPAGRNRRSAQEKTAK